MQSASCNRGSTAVSVVRRERQDIAAVFDDRPRATDQATVGEVRVLVKSELRLVDNVAHHAASHIQLKVTRRNRGATGIAAVTRQVQSTRALFGQTGADARDGTCICAVARLS